MKVKLAKNELCLGLSELGIKGPNTLIHTGS